MSGNGSSPLTSGQYSSPRLVGGRGSILYARLTDANTDEGMLWAGWFFGSSGSVFNKTLTATCTSASVLVRGVGKTLAASCTSTSTLVRSVAKTLLATCTSTSVASAIKAKLLTLTATCTSTSSLVFHSTFARTLAATCTSTSVLIRSIAKKLAATCTSTSVVFGARAFARTLVATCTSTSSVLAHKCITYFQTVTAVCTSTSVVSAIKALAGSIASLASKLRPYKPVPAPVIPGNDTLYLLNELQKVSNAFNAHVAATKDLDARLKAAGW